MYGNTCLPPSPLPTCKRYVSDWVRYVLLSWPALSYEYSTKSPDFCLISTCHMTSTCSIALLLSRSVENVLSSSCLLINVRAALNILYVTLAQPQHRQVRGQF